MNFQNKKLVAREFLMLILCLGIGFITFLILLCLKFSQVNKLNNYQNAFYQYTLKQDSLNREFKNQSINQQKFTAYINETSEEKFHKYHNEELWNRLKYLAEADSIINKWNSYDSSQKGPLINYKITSGQEFQSFILQNIPLLSSRNYNDSIFTDLRIKSANHRKNIFSISTVIKYSFNAFLIAVFLLFILRYLYYAIKWSLGILKNKD